MELNTLTTKEIVEKILQPRHYVDSDVKNLSQEKAKAILSEIIFNRSELSKITNSDLHDILWNLLPACPNGNDDEIIELERELANDVFMFNSNEMVDSEQFDALDEGTIIELFEEIVSSTKWSARNMAMSIYESIRFRGIEERIDKDVLYVFIRNSIPTTDDSSFHSVAETLLKTILNA